MRTTMLKDRLMPESRYEDLRKAVMSAWGSFRPGKEERLAGGNVHLTACSIELDPRSEIMRPAERATFDEDEAWGGLLSLCNQFGFEENT